MRLVCPNCGAQYEVPDDAVPPAGRDVQCSACGHTWFVGAAGLAASDDLDPSAGVPRVEDDDEEADDLAEAAWEDEPRRDDAPADAAPRPARSTVTPEVAEILRSEAEREARVREAERPTSNLRTVPPRGGEPREPPPREVPPREVPPREVPPREVLPATPARLPVPERPSAGSAASGLPSRDAPPRPSGPPRPPREAALGLTPEPDGQRERLRAEEARRRMARLRASPPAAGLVLRSPALLPKSATGASPEAAVPVVPASRRARLPDIEEINSSLTGTPPVADAAPAPATRGSFRLGFGGMLLLGAALALAYAYAPQITGAVPGSRVVLDPYVAAVDEGRLWLDLRLQGLLDAVDGHADPVADPEPDADAGSPATGGSPPPAPVPSRPEAPPPDAPPSTLPEGLAPPEPDDAPATQTLTVPLTEPAGP